MRLLRAFLPAHLEEHIPRSRAITAVIYSPLNAPPRGIFSASLASPWLTPMANTISPASTVSLSPPYDRFPCNQLRRECYRRKLRIIKSGPYANATKDGYMRLLCESDASRPSQQTVDRGWPSSPVRVSPSAPEPRRPLMKMIGDETNRGGSIVASVYAPLAVMKEDCDAEHTPSDMLVVSPRSPTLPSFKDVQRVNNFTASEGKGLLSVVKSTLDKSHFEGNAPHRVLDESDSWRHPELTDFASVVSSSDSDRKRRPITADTSRWEQLHSRLEVVYAKLKALRERHRHYKSTHAHSNGTDEETSHDVRFYESLKRTLQKQLLECVGQI